MIPVRRLNHAVLFVRDLEVSVAFYERAFGFTVVARELRANAAFMRAKHPDGQVNHHDLGLFGVGLDAPRPRPGGTGLYHLAWQVDRIEDLVVAEQTLKEMQALSGASSHGATKSLYGADPDGNEFEVMWMLPYEHWGRYASEAPVERLDLDAEVARWGSAN